MVRFPQLALVAATVVVTLGTGVVSAHASEIASYSSYPSSVPQCPNFYVPIGAEKYKAKYKIKYDDGDTHYKVKCKIKYHGAA